MKSGRLILLIVTFFCYACSQLGGRAPERVPDARTRTLVDTLRNIHGVPQSFKGIGKITIVNDEKTTLSERVAWIGSRPLKFRIEVLFSGRPLIKVASDGNLLYFRNATSESHPYGQLRLTESNLERILSVRIKPDDLMAILSGRIPICKHDRAVLIDDTTRPGHVLVLSRAWGGVVEKIYLDQQLETVREVEMLDSSGLLIYRMTFERMNASLPGRLLVSTDSGDRLRLDIQHFQPDIPVKASMFFLPPP